MAVDLVNVASTERLARGTVLRVTVSQYSKILANRDFWVKVSTFWAELAGTKFMYPISPNPAMRAATPVAVIDVRVSRDKIVTADVVNALEHLAGFYLRISRIERLEAKKATEAGGTTGAREREETKVQQAEREAWKFPDLSKLAGALGTTVSLIKWALVALVVVGIAVAMIYARRVVATVKA